MSQKQIMWTALVALGVVAVTFRVPAIKAVVVGAGG